MLSVRAPGVAYVVGCLLTLMAHSAPLSAAEEQPKPQILFTNVSVFDGKADTLAEGMSVLIEGNLIKKVAKGKINADGAKEIETIGGDKNEVLQIEATFLDVRLGVRPGHAHHGERWSI